MSSGTGVKGEPSGAPHGKKGGGGGGGGTGRPVNQSKSVNMTHRLVTDDENNNDN